MPVGKDQVVAFHYVLKDEAGEAIEKSETGDPMVYLHGGYELLESLEQALAGKQTGEQISVTLQPAEAYGDEQPELIQTMHIDEFNGIDMREGMELQGKDPEGNFRLLRVQKVEGDQVTVNMNHPLAGMVLTFEFDVKDIREATTEEIAHGHAH